MESTAIIAAAFAAKQNAVPVPGGFGIGMARSSHFKGAEFTHVDTKWVVCTAPMLSPSFRLLDATVRHRLEKNAFGAVAILRARPRSDGHGPSPSEAYLRRFQQIAWTALQVLWVLEEHVELGRQFLADVNQPLVGASEFDELANEIDGELQQLSPWSPVPRNSNAAEHKVRDVVGRVLARHGYSRTTGRYAGFWRQPIADGIWSRTVGAPVTFGMEVKLNEDQECPLCQAVELLGHVDAMIYVRVRSESKSNFDRVRYGGQGKEAIAARGADAVP